ncbi:hypothetical protein TTHERM_00491170 (macronuclear) [Tetrahymena thermophila SB210]|uniref:Uncharacterized protein n=1 Tax=Tetrahymena thermophila (strain SB210) TaxID=312017 RepID=Q23J55_TETTS|nr:hypothetical protein TTHERM_00491170 [Tetrahymena thermophila SB210]EAR96649.2 hypothetical protein TTHERM_00491170 [Tetrahymena thermophila SB210]|eukprot:XP_001016894.2 hypothetical protein TTHERM_00491170 [Tetrahymena thermophila SB210]
MSYKQLTQSYIKICLKVAKPTFLLKEFLNSPKDDYNYQYITQNKFAYVRVYDQAQKINKMLIICPSQNYQKYKSFYQEINQRSFRSDLILSMLDSYHLDQDQFFYVFEMEQFNSTLNEIEQQYENNIGFIVNVKKQITEYFKNNLHIFYQTEKYEQDFYICVAHDNQLKVKFNLIDPHWIIQSDIQKNNPSDQIQGKIEKENISHRQLSEMEYEEKLPEEKYYKMSDIPHLINEFCNSFNTYIEKKDLLLRIQNNYANILKFHPKEIFEMIQSHPLYEEFQINYLDELEFELIAKKEAKQSYQKDISLVLQIKQKSQNKNSQFQMKNQSVTQQLLMQTNQILKIIIMFQQKINPQHILFKDSNLISIRAQQNNLETQYEQKTINTILQKDLYSNEYYVEQNLKKLDISQIQEFNKTQEKIHTKFDKSNRNNSLSQIKSQKEAEFILKKYLKEKDVINFVIDSVSLNDNQSYYANIVNQSIRNNSILQNYMDEKFLKQYEKCAYYKLVNLFFQKISENSKEEVAKIYSQLILGFHIFNSLKIGIFKRVFISNIDFRKVKVLIMHSSKLDVIAKIHRIHEDIQITSLRIPVDLFNKAQHAKINPSQNKISYQIFEKEFQLLKLFFSSYDSQYLLNFQQQLLSFLFEEVANFEELELYTIKKGLVNLSKIQNPEILTQDQCQLISENSFQTLVIKFESEVWSIYFIQILIIEEELFYLSKNNPYYLAKQPENRSFQEVMKLEFSRSTYSNLFGQDYAYIFQDNKLYDLQTCFLQKLQHLQKLTLFQNKKGESAYFNLLGCKQIIQLNLELLNYKADKYYNLDNIIKQIDQTKINQIIIYHILSYENEYFKFYNYLKPPLYKLKRLVDTSIKIDWIRRDKCSLRYSDFIDDSNDDSNDDFNDDSNDDFNDDSNNDYFYQNL